LVIRKNKPKKRLPTLEEMLQFIPRRNDFEWSTNDEGLVEIKVPKFESNFGKSFCKLIRKDENITAKMDKIGTIVWKKCDGKNSVKDILETLKKKFPKEEDIDNRLFLFLQQMSSLNYIFLT
jgi:hypothetical protein